MSEPVIRCRSLYKIFGLDPADVRTDSEGVVEPSILEREGVVAAVNHVTLDVSPGETLIVMGPVGVGQVDPWCAASRASSSPRPARWEIEGADLLAMSDRELIDLRRSKMGMVFQNFALLPHRTALENIAFPLQMRGMKRRDYVERARKMIALVGLEGRENNFPRELSGGQQQRVGIARSLAVEPDIWFLDEPFSALDPLIRKEMQDEFLRLQSLLRKTIVFITHDFDEALKLADRMAIMFNGSVEQIGAPEDIVLNPATEYVSRFTSDVPREKVLRVGSVMEPSSDDETVADQAVNVTDRIENVVEYVLAQRLPVPVVDDGDAVVGVLHQAHVLKVLFPTRTEPA